MFEYFSIDELLLVNCIFHTTVVYFEVFDNFFVGYFLTKIFHPNIATNGEICVNTLKKDWNPSLGLRHVLIVSLFAILLVLFHFNVKTSNFLNP